MSFVSVTRATGPLALEAMRRGLSLDLPMTVSEWADRYRVLTSHDSAEPGRWRTSRTPFWREVMDCLSPASPIERVVVMAGAQLGKTSVALNWTGYVVHQAPGPMLFVQPTVEMAKRFSRQRLDPLFEGSPALKDLVRDPRSRDSGNTMLSKEFSGGVLILTGSNSPTGLRSMPVRFLALDEVDAYPASVGEEGDPVNLAMVRTETFRALGRKALLTSTPTIEGASRIDAAYRETDQRKYFVPCVHCGAMAPLTWARVRWPSGRPWDASVVCDACGGEMTDRDKPAMLTAGEWRATAAGVDDRAAGFHLSGLYSPWVRWGDVAAEFDRVHSNPALLQVFVNTRLGETWKEAGDAPDWQRIYDRRETWRRGTVPAGGLLLTAGVDVQKDRLECSIWAWGREIESWLVDHVIIDGGPESERAWKRLTDLLGERWDCAGGGTMSLSRMAIDAGFDTAAVHAWVRKAGAERVCAVKGIEGFGRTSPVSGPTYVDSTERGRKIKRGARFWSVSTSAFKSETYRLLRHDAPADDDAYPAGYVHIPRDVEAEWCKQLVAEHLVSTPTRRGFTKMEWALLRPRNEALDCRVYARAAAWVAGVDRFTERRWVALEAARRDGRAAATEEPVQTPAAAAAAARAEAASPAVPDRRRDDWFGDTGWL